MDKWQFFACHMWLEKGKYEIHREDAEGKDVWAYLNELGLKGWELVSVAPIVGSASKMGLFDIGPREATSTAGYFLWFKRPVPEAA
jgi:hypothetical protein